MEITMEKKYYVYAYLDPREIGEYNFGNYIFKNKPFYIGKGKDSSNRLEKHLKLIKEQNKDLTNNIYKLNVINQILKNGLEPIIIKIVEGLEEQTAYDIESLLIDIMGFRHNKSGILTNLTKGGLGGDTFTNNPNKEEIREKHRLNATGVNNNMYGLSLKERPSHKAKINGNHWNLGRKANDETLKKMSINNTRENNPNAKTVVKMSVNGEEIDTYLTTVEAAEKNNIKHKSGISRACKQGTTAGGFKWKFKN
jgi:hypothetical protein